MSVEVDLLIIGAGPVGRYGAYDAGNGGLSVAVGEVATAVNNAAVHLHPDAQLFPGHSTDLPHDVPLSA